jgi:hypothetical protein
VNVDVNEEVMAQLRPSGRILCDLETGSKALDFNADLYALIPAPVFKGWKVKDQC